jgi:hypothetical protein
MSSFCAKILSPKNYKPNFKHIKAAQRLSYEKAAHKILVKLTPGWKNDLQWFRQTPEFANTYTTEKFSKTEL